MKYLVILLSKPGAILMNMSDQSRKTLVIVALFLLGGCGVYKLVTSIRKLQEPLPAAIPAQLIKPMEGLVKQTTNGLTNYRIERNRSLKKLDSLNYFYNDKRATIHEHSAISDP